MTVFWTVLYWGHGKKSCVVPLYTTLELLRSPVQFTSHHLFSSFIHVNLGSDNHLIWVLTTCILGYLTQPREENPRRGRPKVTIELKGRESCSTQKMEITDFCKTLVPISQTTWCHILEDHNINNNYCDTLGSHRLHNNM